MTEVWSIAALWLGLALVATLLAAVMGSAVIPTLIANAFFLPRYLLPKPDRDLEAMTAPSSAALQAAVQSAEETT